MGSMARTKASGRHGLIGLQSSVQDPMKEVGSVLGLTDYPIHFLTLVFSSQHLLNFLLSSSGFPRCLSVDICWFLMQLPQLPNLHIFIEQLAPDHTSNTSVTLISDNKRAIILKSFCDVESGRKCDKGVCQRREHGGWGERKQNAPAPWLSLSSDCPAGLDLFFVVQGILSRECMVALSPPC